MFNRKIIYSVCVLGSLVGGYAVAAPFSQQPTARQTGAAAQNRAAMPQPGSMLNQQSLIRVDGDVGVTAPLESDSNRLLSDPQFSGDVDAAAAGAFRDQTGGFDNLMESRTVSTDFGVESYGNTGNQGTFTYDSPGVTFTGPQGNYADIGRTPGFAPGFYYSGSQGSTGVRYPLAGVTTYYNPTNEMGAIGYRPMLDPNLTYVQHLDGTFSAYTRSWGAGEPSKLIWSQGQGMTLGSDPRTYTPTGLYDQFNMGYGMPAGGFVWRDAASSGFGGVGLSNQAGLGYFFEPIPGGSIPVPDSEPEPAPFNPYTSEVVIITPYGPVQID